MQRERSVAHQTQQTQQTQKRDQEERWLAERMRELQPAEKREARLRAEEAELRLRAEGAEARQLEEEQKLQPYRNELSACFHDALTDQGYLPPEPSPLVLRRTFYATAGQLRRQNPNPAFSTFIKALEIEIDARCLVSDVLVEQTTKSLSRSPSVLRKMVRRMSGIHESIDRATISIELPNVGPALQSQMREIEVFLSRDWTKETHRGVLAVHIDEISKTTIIQVGIAEHGPVYVTIPEVLRPETAAMKSIEELLKRLAPFTGSGDPMAIIDGAYQGMNYNEVFRKARVYRAPSGNTERLSRNLQESTRRDRLSADNTLILNSAPKNEAEYVRIFPEDVKAQRWPAWGTEAQEWTETVASNQFGLATQVSQEALVTALTEAKNVIVIVAHCDGESIFMPEPPPTGSIVTANYLREHQAEIAANAPLVYLFSCRAGDLSNMRNFASTLLDCGASGVVASQTDVGSAEGRVLLGRLLDERRGAPPLEDYFRAMQDVNYRDLEVFIA